MTKYAHVKDGLVLKYVDLTAAEIAAIPAHKASYILLFIAVATPAFDPATHYAPVRMSDIIGASDVTQAWAAPVAKTAQEIDDELTLVAEGVMASDPMLLAKLIMTGQFDQENRLRVLEGSSTITVDQYLAGLSSLPTISDQKFIAKIKSLL